MKSWQRTLYILALVQFMSAVGFSAIFPFLPLYIEELGSSSGLSLELLAGLVYSAQAFTMMLAAPIWGALADRHGRKMMVLRSTLAGAVILTLMGFVTSAEQLVALRAVQGALTGTVTAVTALVAASVPRERTGYALGLIQVGLWGGAAGGPLIGGVLADAWGFEAPFVVTGVLLALSGGLVWWGVEEHFEPVPSSVRGGGFASAWRHVLAVRGVRLAFASSFLNQLGRNVITPFVPLLIAELLVEAGHTSTVTGLVVGAAALAGTASAIYLGRLGDQTGHRVILLGAAVVAGLLYLPQALVTSVWQLLLLQVVTGAAAGGILPALASLLARYTEPGEEGAVYGLDASIASGARTVAPLVGAALVGVFGLRSVFPLAGLLFLLMAGMTQRYMPETRRVVQAASAD